jgi:hypothetical protein
MEPGLSSVFENGGRPADWRIKAYGLKAAPVKQEPHRRMEGAPKGTEAGACSL